MPAPGADAELVVRYQVANAGWQPLYDARLSTGTKALAAKLQLTRRAAITQRTQESWEQCRADAVDRAAVGRHRDRRAAADDGRFPARAAADAAAADGRPRRRRVARGMAERTDRRTVSSPAMSAAPRLAAKVDAQEIAAQVEASPFQVLYSITGPQTVPNSGEIKRVVIDTDRPRSGAVGAHHAKGRGQGLPLRQADACRRRALSAGPGVAVPRRDLRRHRPPAGAHAGPGARPRLRRRRRGAHQVRQHRREALARAASSRRRRTMPATTASR